MVQMMDEDGESSMPHFDDVEIAELPESQIQRCGGVSQPDHQINQDSQSEHGTFQKTVNAFAIGNGGLPQSNVLNVEQNLTTYEMESSQANFANA
jgi:hypothetical protein